VIPLCLRVFVFATGVGGWICVYLGYLRFLLVKATVLICVICGQKGRADGSVSLWFSWCSWCPLGGETYSLPVSCEHTTAL